jgi:hypothetical protein
MVKYVVKRMMDRKDGAVFITYSRHVYNAAGERTASEKTFWTPAEALTIAEAIRAASRV